MADDERPRRRSRRLADLGEFGFLASLRKLRVPRAGVRIGIGDDCAVVAAGTAPVLVTTDALVEDVHFRWSWQTPRDLGRRAFAVNASDIAAMGGRPRYAVLSIAARAHAAAAALASVVLGFAEAARRCGCALVGGNLSKASSWMISATILGEAGRHLLTRAGGRAGDLVYVSGSLGTAAFGREILLGERRGPRRATAAFLRPRARLDVAEVLARSGAATAAIDVSDGLLADLGHLCRSSKRGAVIEADRLPTTAALRRLPLGERVRLAAAGGEDYELLFTVPPSRASRLESEARRRRVRVTRIGTLTRGTRIELRGIPGSLAANLARGHDHFRRW